MSLWWCQTHDVGFFVQNCFCKIFWGWVSELNTGLKKRRKRASSQIPSPDWSSQDCEKHDTLLREEKSQWWLSAKLSVGVFGLFLYTTAPPFADLFWQLCTLFTIFSSSSCLRKKSTHIAKTCNATLIYMHLLSYHRSIVVATTRWIFYQVAFLYRDSVPPRSLHNHFIPILQTRIYPGIRGWYCLTKTVEEKIAPLLPSFLQHPPRIPETCKGKIQIYKEKEKGLQVILMKRTVERE